MLGGRSVTTTKELCVSKKSVLVFGTGAIGGYVGGALLERGLEVSFLARQSAAQRFDEFGILLTDYQGRENHLRPDIPYKLELSACSPDIDILLLTVKCTDVEQAARQLKGWISHDTLIVCLQNGIGSARTVSEILTQNVVISGMVPFNVAMLEGGRLHRGTQGALKFMVEPRLQPLLDAWNEFGIEAEMTRDFESVAWAKLQLNLNNAINALAGLPLVEQLSQRAYRQVLAACQSELLKALKKAGIKPARLTPLPASLIPWILRLPNWLFRLVARKMLAIDPLARSSMWDDLQRNRHTEIGFLNQQVVDLAESAGLSAPVNRDIVLLVKDAEEAAQGSPNISAPELKARVL